MKNYGECVIKNPVVEDAGNAGVDAATNAARLLYAQKDVNAQAR